MSINQLVFIHHLSDTNIFAYIFIHSTLIRFWNIGINCWQVSWYWCAHVHVYWLIIHPNQHLLSGLYVQILCQTLDALYSLQNRFTILLASSLPTTRDVDSGCTIITWRYRQGNRDLGSLSHASKVAKLPSCGGEPDHKSHALSHNYRADFLTVATAGRGVPSLSHPSRLRVACWFSWAAHCISSCRGTWNNYPCTYYQ